MRSDTAAGQEFFLPRRATRDVLLKRYTEISSSLFKDKPTKYDLDSNKYTASIPREIFAEAGIDWNITDALWGVRIPDGNISEDDRLQTLSIEVSKYALRIGNPRENVSLVLNMNTQGPIFSVEMRPINYERGFEHDWLVGEARRYLKQGYDCHPYGKNYDYNDPKMIEQDILIAENVLNVFDVYFRKAGYFFIR